MARQVNNQTMEHDILNLRAKGLTYNQIADKLKCSKSTVSYWINPLSKANTGKRNKKYRQANRQRLNKRYALWKYNYLFNKACRYCGEKDMLKLQFDHKGKYEKNDNITNMVRKNEEQLTKEANKCRILCASCHQVKTMKERNATFYVVYEKQKVRRDENGCKR
tara:strand:- start:217 stop:708 length:492 start_codon:yes stop_codon:yes gene_type:complete